MLEEEEEEEEEEEVFTRENRGIRSTRNVFLITDGTDGLARGKSVG